MTAADVPPVSEAARWRLRLLAACVFLTGLALIQSPGLLVADTKLDLAIAPLDFISRAAHLWDAEGAFGQLQNQAYGYLWPMGPFFLLGSLMDLPGWIVQRLWLALVMCVALVGSAKLAREFGVRSHVACLVAGFAFALSPRMLTVLGPISIEAWPSALAPWVLLPLVIGATRGSPWKAAALSALAIAMVGGVNAAATSAVLPLGALWLLTRRRGPRKWRMLLAWPLFTALGTLWWLVPLFVLGGYSPPFLDFIESAANTTFPTDLVNALRGTSNWVPYVDASLRAGNDLITYPYLALNSAVVLAAGLVGLYLRRNDERLFWVLGLATGLLLVTLGHTGATQGWFAPQIQDLLDGPLAPLRNVHKFDPVIRLPLVIGLAWTVEELLIRAREPREASARANMRVVIGIVVLAVVGASSPAAVGRITPSGGFETVPDYWSEAAGWLGGQQDEGVALLVPGSSFANYVWGRAQDEPMQSLATGPWAVRNAIPLTPPGSIRMLDGIESMLRAGDGSPAFAAALRRAGVTHLVVRNDLNRRDDIVDPVLVHQALAQSPGVERVASFGPEVGGEAHLEEEGQRILVNGGWQDRYPAIEIYEVKGAPEFAVGSGAATVLAGGPEDTADLSELGVLGQQPVVLAADSADADAVATGDGWVLTDGNRAVERHFGALHDNVSETLLRGQQLRLRAAARDYLLTDPGRWSTFAEHSGIGGVDASGSGSDPSASADGEPGQQPFAALDGQSQTAWTSDVPGDDPPWWQVDLEAPTVLGDVMLEAGPDADQEVVVSTSDWSSDPLEIRAGSTVTVDLPEDEVAWLRVEDASGRPSTRMQLAEVVMPGVLPARVLRLPEPPEGYGNPQAIVLRAVNQWRTGCAEVDEAVRCVAGRAVDGEEPLGFRRAFSLSTATDVPARLLVRPRPGPALDEALLSQGLFAITASSAGNPDPRAGAVAAVDGDPGTTWTADGDEDFPLLQLRWVGKRRVAGLSVDVDDDTAARLPTTVRLSWPGGSRLVDLEDGVGTFRPIRTASLEVSVVEAEATYSLDFSGVASEVPIGISELEVEGLPFLPAPLSTQALDLPCGSGPQVVVNGLVRRTSVTASPAELYSGEPVPADLCRDDEISLAADENRVDVSATELFTPDSLVLGEGVDEATSVLAGSIGGPSERRMEPDGSPLVTTRENANPGWQAPDARSFVADGWRQAYAPTAADELLVARFAPGGLYRAGLLGGLALLVLLLGLTIGLILRRPRRDHASLRTWAAGSVTVTAVAAVIGGLLVGTPGAIIAVIGAGVAIVSARRLGPYPPAGLGALLIVVAVGSQVVLPWGGATGWAGDLSWPSYLVVASCSVALGAAAVPLARSHRGVVARRRMAGISTTR